MMDIEQQVCADILERQQLGIKKYGTTLAQNPLDLRQWLTHQYQELLDAALYCRRALAELDRMAERDAKLSEFNKAVKEIDDAGKRD